MTRFRRALRIAAFVTLFFVALLIVAIASTQTAWFKDWLRRYVSRESARYLNAELVIGRIDGNLFTGVELERVSLVQHGETILAAKDVGLDYNALDFISGGIVLDAIRINEPTVMLRRGAAGWNLAGLVKEEASEADREGPGTPIHIGTIGISNGTLTIVDASGVESSVRLPRHVSRIDLKGTFDYKPVDFTIELAHLSLRTSEPDLALNSLSGRVIVNNDDVRVERLAIRTAESSLSAQGSIRDYLGTPSFDLALSSDRMTPRELGGLIPSLATVKVSPAFELTARGPLSALQTTLNLRSDAGNVRANLLADAEGPVHGAKGTLALDTFDLSRVADGLPASEVNATSDIDVTVDASLTPRGRAHVKASPTRVAGYRLDALDATAMLDEGRARIDGTMAAYGARATAKGPVTLPLNGRRLALDLEGRAMGLNLKRLPRALGAPALATNLSARYRVGMQGARTEGSLTFDRSTIEGASITAGTHARATLEGPRLAYAARGGLREVDPQRLGAALRLPSLADPRLAGRVDADFDVDGTGRTLKTLEARAHLVVPRATLTAGALRDVDVNARVAKGALEATLTTSFVSIDPAVAASKPELAGAVSGSLESQVSLPDLTKPALETTSGRARLTLQPSRVASQSIDRASLSVSLAAGVLDVQQFDAAGPLGAAKASGKVALTQTDQSTLGYHVELADLTAAAALAGQKDIAGAVTLDGSVAGNRAELRTTGALSAANVRYGTTVRAVDTDARYDITLPDLDVNRVRAAVNGKASLVEAAGRSIREVTLDARYADRQAAFETRVMETAERTLEAKGVVALPPGGGVDLGLERLAISAPDASWSTTAPARVVYGGERVDVEGLKLASGDQRLTIDGSVALGAELATSTVSRDRPLKITAENLDLAAVDRLAGTGRELAGRLNATATMAGSVAAPLVDATAGVRDGAFGEFKYQTLDATLHHDASSARVEARLDQGAAWVNLRGTLPTLQALRSESGGRTAPVDVTLETSPIELSVLQAFTTAVKDLKGVTQANVHVTGSVAAPIVAGRVQVTDGALTVAATETPFAGLNADIAMKGDRVDVARFEVADKDGHRLTATGGLNVSLAERSWRDVDARLTGEDFKLLDGDLGKLSVDVDLALRGAPTGLRAEGKVAVRDGRIEIDRVLEQFRPQAPAPPSATEGDSAVAPRVTVTGADGVQVVSSVAAIPDGSRARRERRAAPTTTADAGGSMARAASSTPAPSAAAPASSPTPSLADTIGFDVRVTVPNNLVVRGDAVKVGGEGMSLGDLNMTLGGEIRATRRSGGRAFVVGSVRTVRGFYEFQGRRFDLVRDGSVSFKGPDATNPQVDVSATRDISGVEARVRVHGEAQRPELELSSAPPLDEADILSLIIFNRPINDLGEGEKTSLAQQAGSLVGGFVASPVAEALRDALDVDLLEITPVTDDGAPSVSIGNQIGERVFVKVRQQFGSSENTQLVLEYELSKLLRLETNVSQGGDTSRAVGQRAERGGADLVFVIKY